MRWLQRLSREMHMHPTGVFDFDRQFVFLVEKRGPLAPVLSERRRRCDNFKPVVERPVFFEQSKVAVGIRLVDGVEGRLNRAGAFGFDLLDLRVLCLPTLPALLTTLRIV